MQRGCRAAFMGTLPTGQDSTPNSADQSGDHYLKTAACLDTHADCPYSDSSTTSQADLVDLGAADLDPLDVSGTNAAPHDSRGSILGAAAQPACIADNAQAPAAILRQYAAFAGSLLMSLTAELQQLMTASTMDAPCSHSTEHHINDMPSLSSDQWLSQADSADGIEELVAAGEHDAAHSSSAQDQLQPAEHVLLSHVDSPWLVSIEISAVLTGAAVNLATQCVDLMLLLPDDPESQPDTVQQAPLPETYLATEKQQSADQNSFGSVAQPHSFSLDMAFFTIYMVIINVCTVCICIVYRNTLK